MSKAQNLRDNVVLHQITGQGRFLYQSLEGFAELLDSVGPEETLDPVLFDVYMCITLKNGSSLKLTNQIVDVTCTRNVVRIVTDDLINRVAPKSIKIFDLSDVCSIESIDTVDYAKKHATEENTELVTEEETATEEVKTPEATNADNSKTSEIKTEVKTENKTGKAE